MKNTIKQTVVAAAVAAAMGFAGQASAAGTILFDRDGLGGATGAIRVDTFDWGPDNILAQNMLSQQTVDIGGGILATGATSFSTNFATYLQGVLGGFSSDTFTNLGAANCTASGGGSSCSAITGSQFTFELATRHRVTSAVTTGNSTALIIDNLAGGPPNPGVPNVFKIYYNPTPGANGADIPAGTGYNTGSVILEGLVYDSAWNYALDQNDADLRKLDSKGSDQRTNVGTYSGNGSAQFDITVTSQDFNFFVSNILGTTVTVGMNLSTQTSNPFQQAEPSALVMGNTPFYGNDTKTGIFTGGTGGAVAGTRTMNDFNCGAPVGDVAGTVNCDHHMQNDGSSAFFNPLEVPEPGSLALFGVGLLGFGWLARRARRKVA